jgi:acetolactate synthase-1/2/3 large subunit
MPTTTEKTEYINTMAKIKLSDYVFNQLNRFGVNKVFGVPGGACMHLFNSATTNSQIEVIPAFHEQASGFAAQSYSEIVNNISVCLVTAGPGLTNALTGMAACWIESAPVIFIGGQAKTEDLASKLGVRTSGQQEVDGVAMAKPVTKMSICLKKSRDIYKVLTEAIEISMSGRKGPVFIEIPLDVQASIIDDRVLRIKNSRISKCW